jgi:GntR family transcriptional regulator, transcriptional repressor for pyruvate dehydrogenase complex
MAMKTTVDVPTRRPPRDRPDLSAYLSQQVIILIRDRQLKPGDRLPSAKALANLFSVATPTIREALRRLQAIGIVDIRHGSGIYVRREGNRLMLSNPGYGALETQTIMQVLDARMLIEPHLAQLAATRATEQDLVDLTALLAQAEQSLERPDDRYIRANHELHAGIARASGNLVLTHVVESLLEMYSTELHLVDPNSTLAEIRARDHRNHQLVIDAIAAGDGGGAFRAMVRHIETARSSIEWRVAT